MIGLVVINEVLLNVGLDLFIWVKVYTKLHSGFLVCVE